MSKDEQFEYFKERCYHWAQELGLVGWRMHFRHDDIGDAFAQYDSNYDGRAVTLTLTNNNFNNKDGIDRTAFHELVHVKLHALQILVDQQYNSLIESEEHEIIGVFERLLFGSEGE